MVVSTLYSCVVDREYNIWRLFACQTWRVDGVSSGRVLLAIVCFQCSLIWFLPIRWSETYWSLLIFENAKDHRRGVRLRNALIHKRVKGSSQSVRRLPFVLTSLETFLLLSPPSLVLLSQQYFQPLAFFFVLSRSSRFQYFSVFFRPRGLLLLSIF